MIYEDEAKTIEQAYIYCNLQESAFDSEVVFSVLQSDNSLYQGVSPKHYAQYDGEISPTPQRGTLQVRPVEIKGNSTRIELPDGEIIPITSEVFAKK